MKKAVFAACLLMMSSAALAGEPRAFVDGSWKAILQAHAGHATIIHFWGLTCAPCRIEMANWGHLLDRRHDFDFVSVDTDMVPVSPSQTEAFLTKSGVPATEEVWRFDDGFAEKLYFQVDPLWQGEIPMTVLLGKDGRIERITGSADPKSVEAWLDQQDSHP
jgi:thiol-disulfide isomerase/thioredoxin